MVIGYVRVSTGKQDLQNQRLEILDWANREKVSVDEWVELTMSSRKSVEDRRIDELLERMVEGDKLVVAELSRLGRSLSQVIHTVEALTRKKVDLVAIKEGLRIVSGKQDIASKTMVAMFGLLAEIERDLISMRTKAGLARARKEGKQIGRPKGSLGKSKLDGREEEIVGYLEKGLNKTAIGKLVGASRQSVGAFIESRGLAAKVEARERRRGGADG